MKDSVILLSGGIDSVTLLYDKKERISIAIFFDYDANHNTQELKWAKWHCERLGIQLLVINLGFMKDYFSGNILQGADSVTNGDDFESKKDSVVPFRNGVMLSIACGIAESNMLKYVLIANHKGELITLPDCSDKFISHMNSAMKFGTYLHVGIIAPYTGLNKSDIVRNGNKIGVDYSKTYSCYKGKEKHCGVCPACIERKKSMLLANVADNIIYEQ